MDSPSSSLLSSVLSFPEVLKRFLAWRVLTCNEKPQSKTSHRSDVSDRLRTLRQPIGRASDCENRRASLAADAAAAAALSQSLLRYRMTEVVKRARPSWCFLTFLSMSALRRCASPNLSDSAPHAQSAHSTCTRSRRRLSSLDTPGRIFSPRSSGSHVSCAGSRNHETVSVHSRDAWTLSQPRRRRRGGTASRCRRRREVEVRKRLEITLSQHGEVHL